jgi:hypothetical protein
MGEQPVSFEIALKVTDAAVYAKTARHLRNIEIAVLQGAWQGQKYDQIAADQGYAPEYIKHDVGPKLWQLLSFSFGEKVSKSNLVAVIAQHTHSTEEAITSPDASPVAVSPSLIRPNGAVTDWESPVGLIPLDSRFYIDRPPVESRCYEEILRPGALIRIKAPSQMGKTSLMVRILAQAKHHRIGSDASDMRTVPLSLQQADKAAFSDLDRFLRWFCAALTRKLQLTHRVEDYWSDTFGSKSNCTAYLEDCLLPEMNGVLIIALDPIDQVFLHPEIADDFFALLRSWYEEAAYGESGNPLWQNLRLIIVHSTEVYIPLDINKSPFNVGLPIELHEFTPEQVWELAQRYNLTLTPSDLTALMHLIGGHPCLVQQALCRLARQELDLPHLLQTAPTDAGIYHNALHRHLSNLQEHPELAIAFHQLVKSPHPLELDQLIAFKLRSMGLVRFEGNQVTPSCELYRQYFNDRTFV